MATEMAPEGHYLTISITRDHVQQTNNHIGEAGLKLIDAGIPFKLAGNVITIPVDHPFMFIDAREEVKQLLEESHYTIGEYSVGEKAVKEASMKPPIKNPHMKAA